MPTAKQVSSRGIAAWSSYETNISTALQNKGGSNSTLNVYLSLNPVLISKVQKLEACNKLLVDVFAHQRKAFRYYKAATELEQGEITEEEFNKIEDTCVISLKSDSIDNVKQKARYLANQLQQFYPEELESLPYDELADLLQVSSAKLNLYLRS